MLSTPMASMAAIIRSGIPALWRRTLSLRFLPLRRRGLPLRLLSRLRRLPLRRRALALLGRRRLPLRSLSLRRFLSWLPYRRLILALLWRLPLGRFLARLTHRRLVLPNRRLPLWLLSRLRRLPLRRRALTLLGRGRLPLRSLSLGRFLAWLSHRRLSLSYRCLPLLCRRRVQR